MANVTLKATAAGLAVGKHTKTADAVRTPTTIAFSPASSFTPTAGGAAFPVTATIKDQFGAAIASASGTWASQNAAVASLTQNGKTATVTPVSAGQAVLTFTVYRGVGLPALVASVQVGVAAPAGGSYTGARYAPRYTAPAGWAYDPATGFHERQGSAWHLVPGQSTIAATIDPAAYAVEVPLTNAGSTAANRTALQNAINAAAARTGSTIIWLDGGVEYGADMAVSTLR